MPIVEDFDVDTGKTTVRFTDFSHRRLRGYSYALPVRTDNRQEATFPVPLTEYPYVELPTRWVIRSRKLTQADADKPPENGLLCSKEKVQVTTFVPRWKTALDIFRRTYRSTADSGGKELIYTLDHQLKRRLARGISALTQADTEEANILSVSVKSGHEQYNPGRDEQIWEAYGANDKEDKDKRGAVIGIAFWIYHTMIREQHQPKITFTKLPKDIQMYCLSYVFEWSMYSSMAIPLVCKDWKAMLELYITRLHQEEKKNAIEHLSTFLAAASRDFIVRFPVISTTKSTMLATKFVHSDDYVYSPYKLSTVAGPRIPRRWWRRWWATNLSYRNIHSEYIFTHYPSRLKRPLAPFLVPVEPPLELDCSDVPLNFNKRVDDCRIITRLKECSQFVGRIIHFINMSSAVWPSCMDDKCRDSPCLNYNPPPSILLYPKEDILLQNFIPSNCNDLSIHPVLAIIQQATLDDGRMYDVEIDFKNLVRFSSEEGQLRGFPHIVRAYELYDIDTNQWVPELDARPEMRVGIPLQKLIDIFSQRADLFWKARLYVRNEQHYREAKRRMTMTTLDDSTYEIFINGYRGTFIKARYHCEPGKQAELLWMGGDENSMKDVLKSVYASKFCEQWPSQFAGGPIVWDYEMDKTGLTYLKEYITNQCLLKDIPPCKQINVVAKPHLFTSPVKLAHGSPYEEDDMGPVYMGHYGDDKDDNSVGSTTSKPIDSTIFDDWSDEED